MLHLRLALPLVLAVGAAAHGRAQVMVAPPLQPEKEKPPAEQAKGAEDKPEPWRLQPAAEPDPALRYRFWPALHEQVPANPMPFVNRAIILLQQGDHDEFWKDYMEWSDLPLEELPVDDVKAALAEHARVPLKELERAENLMQLEYDLRMQELSIEEMVSTLLPEFQEMRSLARLLRLRGRVAIAEGRWVDLARDIRRGFRLAEVAGHSTDLLISRLIGIAIAHEMMGLVEEAIQQPRSPNFYWALATIPDRLFEVRRAIQFESAWAERFFPELPKLSDEPIGEAAAQAWLQQLAREAPGLTPFLPASMDPASKQLIVGALLVTWAEPAREYLAETTDWAESAHGLSSAEAVLRASRLKLNRLQDSWVKWTLLPPELFSEYQHEIEEAMQAESSPTDPIVAIARTLIPAVETAHRAGRRGLHERNFLLTVEALRMHAAQRGSLPASLNDLQPVPAWSDAMANEPFGYERLAPNRATLSRESRYPGDQETTIEIHLQIEGNDR